MGALILAGNTSMGMYNGISAMLYVVVQRLTGEIWFGRDVFGRRSLLWHLPTSNEDCFALCSAARQCGKALPEVSVTMPLYPI